MLTRKMLSLYNQLIKNVIYVVGITDFRDLLKHKNDEPLAIGDLYNKCNLCNMSDLWRITLLYL